MKDRWSGKKQKPREEWEDEQKILRGEQNDYSGQLENLLECFHE